MSNIILIAGGAGFIGRYLCEHHLECGDSVICVDNLYSIGVVKNIPIEIKNNNLLYQFSSVMPKEQFIMKHYSEIASWGHYGHQEYNWEKI